MSEMVRQMLLRMSEIEPISVRWAWDGFVPMGRVSMITGGPGVGKSLVALQVAAMMTRGVETLSDDQSCSGANSRSSEGGSPRGVLVLSAADDLQDTVLPRLIAAGADPSLIFCLKGNVVEETDDVMRPNVRPFLLSQDMQKLSDCLTELSQQTIEVGLIVIDSIDRYLGANEKKSVRIEMVAQLADLAARSGAAVLVTANTSMKAGSRGGTVVYQELFNAARSVLMVAEDLEGTERRRVVSLKHNLTALPETLSFVVRDGVVRWETGRERVSTAESVVNVRRNRMAGGDGLEMDPAFRKLKECVAADISATGIGEENDDAIWVAGGFDSIQFWSETSNRDQVTQLMRERTTRESVLKKREVKRRERKARRASNRRNRCG